MLDQDLCEFLEYRICSLLANTDSEKLKGFWCDGVLLPTFESEYSQKYVHDNRQVILKAYIGKDGQQVYKVIIKFGPKALDSYAVNSDIQECVPDANDENRFTIDTEKFEMVLELL